MFSRQHYEAIAETLKANKPGKACEFHTRTERTKRRAGREHHRCIVDQIAGVFSRDNPRFNWTRFMTACGY